MLENEAKNNLKMESIQIEDSWIKSNDFCSVPILQKVLTPCPGFTTRLYSVQVMRSAEAVQYYQSVKGDKQVEEKNESCREDRERERSPAKYCSSTEKGYLNSLENKDFKHYKA